MTTLTGSKALIDGPVGETMKKLRDILGDMFAKGGALLSITEPFNLVADRTVAEICSDFELQEETKPYLSG